MILDNFYKKIEPILKNKQDKLSNIISNFVQKNSNELYYHSPAYRIYYSENDKDNLLKLFDMTENDILSLIQDAFYFKLKNYNPRAMKDPITVLILMIYRYSFINNINKNLCLIYLCFSPKVYLSIHVGQFPEFPPCESEKNMGVMDYTISSISNKFEIKKKGTLIGSIISIAENWEKSYSSRIKNASDEDLCYIFQQLHNRIKQSLITLSKEYYNNLENPKAILFYSSDRYDKDSYRLSESNYMMISKYVSNSMEYLLSSDADIKICKAVSSKSEIPPLELKSLVETIISNKNNIKRLNMIITNIISNYYSESKYKNKDIRDISFLNYSLTRKANSNNKEYNELINEIRKLLLENSERYFKRRKRPATEAAYVNSLLGYFVMIIHKSNK